jgi:hypothetical protein
MENIRYVRIRSLGLAVSIVHEETRRVSTIVSPTHVHDLVSLSVTPVVGVSAVNEYFDATFGLTIKGREVGVATALLGLLTLALVTTSVVCRCRCRLLSRRHRY